MQRALDIQYVLGNEHEASVVTSLGNLAAVSAQLGRLEQALEYDRRAVEVALEAYPGGHSTIGRAWYSLSDSLRQTGRYDEALSALDEALAIQRQAGMEAEIELIDLARARTLFAFGRYDQAASVAAAVRPALAQRWGEGSREALLPLEVELAARGTASPDIALEKLVAEASERLSALDEDQRGASIADLLRWRLAEIELNRGRPDRVGYWLDFQRGGAAEPTQSTLVLRWLAVQLRRQAQLGVADADLEARLTRAMERPGSNADARAYAWCAMAESARAGGDQAALEIAMQRLDEMLRDAPLSEESRQMVFTLRSADRA
ncbi:MAG: tetratricopeptide repeat protein [Wenzhouxiangellaceae bacterium]